MSEQADTNKQVNQIYLQGCLLMIVVILLILLMGCTSEVAEITPTVSLPTQGTAVPTHSPTPTSVPSTQPVSTTTVSTESATPLPTPTVASENTPTFSVENVKTKLFMFGPLGFQYRVFDPVDQSWQEINTTPFVTEQGTVCVSTNLAFHPYKNQIAFWIHNPDEVGSLWLAGITLNEAKQVFQDEARLFTTDGDCFDPDVTVDWFTNNSVLLTTSANPSAHPLLLHTDTLQSEEWLWQCDTIILSPQTTKPAWLCNQSGDQRLIVEWNGEAWNTEEELFVALWKNRPEYPAVWSPFGTQTAFVDPESPAELQLVGAENLTLSVPLNVSSLDPHTIRWTADGSRILVGGSRPDWLESWFVMDSQTGEIIWNLENTQEFSWDGTPFGIAEISSAGDFVVMQTRNQDTPAGNWLILIDVNNNRYEGIIADVGWGYTAFAWGR